jgi:hypothetical protein
MKTTKSILLILVALTLFIWTGCAKEGPAGKDGNANVISSEWIHPTSWNGQTGDWYFDVSNSAINSSIVEQGVILAYVSLPGDIYPAAVRPLPSWALGSNWDFLIPDYGQIEFTSDALTIPGTTGYSFRYILIPANNFLKSTGSLSYSEELRNMSYLEVCKKFGIPE